MMTSTRATTGTWIAGNSLDMRHSSSSIPGLEDDPRWRSTTACDSPIANELSIKEGIAQAPNFSKGVLEDEWYIAATPDNSLMDEMKELSYASALAQPSDSGPSSHFNLDSPHLQSFLSRNVNRSFTNLDPRPSMSSFLERGISFDGNGSSPLINFRTTGALTNLSNSILLDNQNGNITNRSLTTNSILVPGNGPNVPTGNRANLNSTALLSNLSPRHSLGDSFNHNLGNNNLSCILTTGMNSNFTSPLGTTLPNSFSHGLGTGFGNNSFGNGFGNSLSSNVPVKENSVVLEMPQYRSKNIVHSSSAGGNNLPGQLRTIYQKRAALRIAASDGSISPSLKSPPRVVTCAANDSSLDMPDEESPNIKLPKTLLQEPSKKESRKAPQTPGSDEVVDLAADADTKMEQADGKEEEDMDESGEGSGFLYETDDTLGIEGAGQGVVATLPGEKGKGKKGLPAKNLMAERRRRKKLNDRLFLLRSVVPKITKMDRASILGDAIEYLKELLQRINDLHNELESVPVERPLPPSPPSRSPSLPGLPTGTNAAVCRVKEEIPIALPCPSDSQPPRVEVRTREGRALNIHMFCARRPGLLLSAMRALDGLGLDVQQAVISCFNGFALDVFRAEQSKDGDVGPDEIKAVLLHTAGSNMGSLQ